MIEVKGQLLDDETRCQHYHSTLDVIAIKFKCCNDYYPCFECHQQAVSHEAQVWEKEEWNTKAVLCGVCKTELTVQQYLDSNNECPYCKAAFNPKCSNHYHLYFEK